MVVWRYIHVLQHRSSDQEVTDYPVFKTSKYYASKTYPRKYPELDCIYGKFFRTFKSQVNVCQNLPYIFKDLKSILYLYYKFTLFVLLCKKVYLKYTSFILRI